QLRFFCLLLNSEKIKVCKEESETVQEIEDTSESRTIRNNTSHLSSGMIFLTLKLRGDGWKAVLLAHVSRLLQKIVHESKTEPDSKALVSSTTNLNQNKKNQSDL
ncbi:hypothetical protein XENORESO_019258, partial [Xenotaenia resolanae]